MNIHSPQQHVQLQQFYRGKWFRDGIENGDFTVTAWSPGLRHPEAERLFANTNLGPYSRVNVDHLEHAYALLCANSETYLLLHVRQGPHRVRSYSYPDYRCIVVPTEVLKQLRGNLQPLWELLDDRPHLPALESGAEPLALLSLTVEQATLTEERNRIHAFLNHFEGDQESYRRLGTLITAVLGGHCVAVQGAPLDPQLRRAFCDGLLLLLPPPLRHTWTFATEVLDSDRCPAQIKFLYQDPYIKPAASDVVYQWRTGQLAAQTQTLHPYARFVMRFAEEGADSLITQLHSAAVAQIVSQFSDVDMSECLAFLAYQLIFMPYIENNDADKLGWSSWEQLLMNRLRMLPQLSDDVLQEFRPPMIFLCCQLADQGFGAEVFTFLHHQLQTQIVQGEDWENALGLVASTYAYKQGVQVDENALLRFMGEVSQARNYFTDEAWNDFFVALWPVCQQSLAVTLELLNLWLEDSPKTDYRGGFLFDQDIHTCLPEELAKLRSYWLHSSQGERPSLIDAGAPLRQQDQFLLDMVAEAIKRNTLELIDGDVLERLETLLQQAERRDEVLSLFNHIVDAQEQLEVSVRRRLPLILIALGRIDQTVSFLSALATQPAMQDELIWLVSEICRSTASLDNAIQFLQSLEQVPSLSETLYVASWGILSRQRWPRGQLTPHYMSVLTLSSQRVIEVILHEYKDWTERAKPLADLWKLPAVTQIPKLKSVIISTIDTHVLSLHNDALLDQIQEIDSNLSQHAKELYASTRIPAMAHLVKVVGLRKIKEADGYFDAIDYYLDVTVEILNNLKPLLAYWDIYQDEFRRQLDSRRPSEQEHFRRNCIRLLMMINPTAKATPDGLEGLRQLLERVDQTLTSPTESERSSGKSLFGRIWGNKG